LGKNNQGSRVLEVKIISIIEGFVYDKVVVLHTSRYDFVPGAKIKSQDLLLRPRIIHQIITHNMLPKKGNYKEVSFIDLCLIDYMIRGQPINLLHIIMRNLIRAHDQKKKSLTHGQCLTTIFKNYEI
jgi:hypothetical protein